MLLLVLKIPLADALYCVATCALCHTDVTWVLQCNGIFLGLHQAACATQLLHQHFNFKLGTETQSKSKCGDVVWEPLFSLAGPSSGFSRLFLHFDFLRFFFRTVCTARLEHPDCRVVTRW